MDFSFWKDKKIRYGILGAAVLVITLLALYIRMIPMNILAGSGDMIAGPDAWYNLRLVEVAIANGLAYPMFEPMTLFPTGQEIVWGPLFTWISSIFAMIAGAASRTDIVTAVSWVPALMGAAMVPVMFFLGKKLGDWKTGLLSALFIAIIGGTYLSRSVYGHFDHHVAETLFSTLFCLTYIIGINALRKLETIDLKNISTLKLPIIYGVIAGIAYLLGIFTMTTIVVFGLFVSIFTLIQFIIDHRAGKPTEYLLTLNVITFTVTVIGLLIYGIRDMSFSLTNYSMGILFAHILLILGTIVLYLISKLICKIEKPWYYYLVSLAVISAAGILFMQLAMPNLFGTMIGGLSGFFTTSAAAATVAEMHSWNIGYAAASFNWGVILAVGGFVYLIYKLIKDKSPEALFVIIWTTLMFLATVSHIRWEYYFAANAALLAAVFVSWGIDFGLNDAVLMVKNIISKLRQKPEVKEEPVMPQSKKNIKQNTKKNTSKKPAAKPAKTVSNKSNYGKIALFAAVIIIGILFTGCSAADSIKASEQYAYSGTTPYWTESCEWLENNTPETGIDYLTIYNKEGFEYPKEAYGVLSWWDYGHYITTIGKRIPNANPFQSGVGGDYGVARVLVSTDESVTTEKLDHLGTKYVMTDYIMANDIFGAIAVWNDTSAQLSPYCNYFIQQDSNGAYQYGMAYTPEYYNTFVTKLQMFDGSYTAAKGVHVVITDSSAGYGPVISFAKYYDNANDGWAAANKFNSVSSNINSGKRAIVISAEKTPTVDVPALKHFRLIHDSKDAYVKTFEYVKGAVIKGDGTIQHTVITNQGRVFTYTQKSENGQFVVPYSGKYTITETGRTITVSEDAVINGLQVN